jgi:hypothetical protein
MDELKYEVYVEVFYIQMWRDNAVYRTESGGCRWMRKEIVDANMPTLTNVIYAAANDEFANNNMTVRRRKEVNND